MAGYIEIESTFDGTATFVGYGRLSNDKHTPYIELVCQDNESGKTARATLFCSQKALPYTVKTLRALGCAGDDDQSVIAEALNIAEAECTFDVVEKDGFFHADNVRGRGEAATGGTSATMSKADFLAAVFGASPAVPAQAQAQAPARSATTVTPGNCPF